MILLANPFWRHYFSSAVQKSTDPHPSMGAACPNKVRARELPVIKANRDAFMPAGTPALHIPSDTTP